MDSHQESVTIRHSEPQISFYLNVHKNRIPTEVAFVPTVLEQNCDLKRTVILWTVASLPRLAPISLCSVGPQLVGGWKVLPVSWGRVLQILKYVYWVLSTEYMSLMWTWSACHYPLCVLGFPLNWHIEPMYGLPGVPCLHCQYLVMQGHSQGHSHLHSEF